MDYLSLFTGGRGLDMAFDSLYPNSRTVAMCENDPAASTLLRHHRPDISNLGDARTADWESVGLVDAIIGGYPCQPYSIAGHKKGTDDERDGWPWFFDAIRVLRPRFIFAENVPNHVGLGVYRTFADLASIGFDVEWGSLRASEVGACHPRERLFILAWDAEGLGMEGLWTEGHSDAEEVAGTAIPDSTDPRTPRIDWKKYSESVHRWEKIIGRSHPEPLARGLVNPDFLEWMMGWPQGSTDAPGVSNKDRIKILGNGVVPLQAEVAFRLLCERAQAR